MSEAYRLLGCNAKVDRAREHLLAFVNELRQFGDDGQNLDPDRDEIPGLRWGLIIGDAVHNFRCALDHLVFQLAMLGTDGQQPGDTTQFPIADDPDMFDRQSVRMLAGVRPEDRDLIRKHQPFSVVEEPRPAALELLRDLSNFDKHRILHPVLIAPGFSHEGREVGPYVAIGSNIPPLPALDRMMAAVVRVLDDIEPVFESWPEDHRH